MNGCQIQPLLFTLVLSLVSASCFGLELEPDYFSSFPVPEKRPYRKLLEVLGEEIEPGKIQKFISSLESPLELDEPDNQIILSEKLSSQLGLKFFLDHYHNNPPTVKILSESLIDGVIQRRLLIKDDLIGSFEARLLLPPSPKRKHPAILGLHGHGGSTMDFSQRSLSVELAREGYFLLSPQFRAMRRIYEAELSRELVKRGSRLMGVRLYEVFLGFEILRSLPLVDQQRIGMLSHSGGSLIANLFTRVFLEADGVSSTIKALVFDYKSGFLGEWNDLCCESLPALHTWKQLLQKPQSAPCPSLEVPYDFQQEAEDIRTLFKKHLQPPSKSGNFPHTPLLDPALTRTLVSPTPGRQPSKILKLLLNKIKLHPYPIRRDQSLLKLQDLTLTTKLPELLDGIKENLTLPESKISFLLNNLTHESLAHSKDSSSTLQQLDELIRGFTDSKDRYALTAPAISRICRSSAKLCLEWLNQLKGAFGHPLQANTMEGLTHLARNGSLATSVKLAKEKLTTFYAFFHLKNLREETLNPVPVELLEKEIQAIKKNPHLLTSFEKCILNLPGFDNRSKPCSLHLNQLSSKVVDEPHKTLLIIQKLKEFQSTELVILLSKSLPDRVDRARFLFENFIEPDLSKNFRNQLYVYLEQEFKNISEAETAVDYSIEMIRGSVSLQPEKIPFWVKTGLGKIKDLRESYQEGFQREVWAEFLESVTFLTFGELVDFVQRVEPELRIGIVREALKESLNYIALITYNSMAVKEREIVLEDMSPLHTQFEGHQQEFSSRLTEFKQVLEDSRSYQGQDDWIEVLDEDSLAIGRPLFQAWISTLHEYVDSEAGDRDTLENLWILNHLAGRLHLVESRQWLQKAIFRKWKEIESDDSIHWATALGFLEVGEVSKAQTILKKIHDKDIAREAKILLLLQDPSTSLNSYSEAISLLTTSSWEHQEFLLQKLFDHASREQFSSNFTVFSNLFENLESSKEETVSTRLDWIATAVRLGFTSEAVPRLTSVSQNLVNLPLAHQIAVSEPIITLWLDLENEPKAQSIFLNLLGIQPQDSELRTILREEIQQIQEDYPTLVSPMIVDIQLEDRE
jgi:hypothetical protein